MNILEDIRARMELRYPHAEVHHDATSITYVPSTPEGFSVRLVVRNPGPRERYLVYYDTSLQQLSGCEESILDFALGLSTGCRLRVFSRRGRPYRWVTEGLGFSGWRACWENYAFSGAFWRFWGPVSMRLLQNRLIDLSDGSGGACGGAPRT